MNRTSQILTISVLSVLAVILIVCILKHNKENYANLGNMRYQKYGLRPNKPIILSIGMSTLSQISRAVKAAKSVGTKKIVLLYCISGYPTPNKDFNLLTLQDLKKKFKVIVGLSDHSKSSIVANAAVSLGANVIEKHFKLDDDEDGYDSKFSINPRELKELCENIDY